MKELFLENLAISSKNVGKINIFGENLLKKYSKIGVIWVLLYSKIEVIYVVKISVSSKSIPKSRIIPKSGIPKSGFYCTTLLHKYNVVVVVQRFIYDHGMSLI